MGKEKLFIVKLNLPVLYYAIVPLMGVGSKLWHIVKLDCRVSQSYRVYLGISLGLRVLCT